jgi:low temperature requirement protein LtrA
MQVTGLAEKYKSATYIEFFFDLVFVYGLTRISSLLYDDPTQWYKPLVLVLMVWWGWSQYAWATNALALDDKADKLLMLVGTGVTFFAALTIPQTFTSQITWFGALYTISRVIASLMHIIASKHDSVQKKTLTRIYLFLIPSTIFILIGSFAQPIIQNLYLVFRLATGLGSINNY